MKIQYQNKQGIIDPTIPQTNQVTDNDMNEIKSVVNHNADSTDSAVESLTNTFEGISDRLDGHDTDITEINGSIADINEDIGNIETDLSNVYTKTETDNLLNDKANVTSLNEEVSARENADVNLQNQIDSIVASSDVVDIVGTYADLQNYDTSKLGDNDIIKVLDDSTHNDATSYYRWKKHTSTWQYIGSEGPYYTKGQADELLNGKVDKVQGKGLSENDFTNALKTKLDGIESGAQVNKLESIKVNGSTQIITDKSVDISVPTKTSQISNDSGYITKDVNNLTNYYKKTETYTQAETNTLLNAKENTSNKVTSLSSSSTDTQYPSAKCVYDLIGDINTALDLINGEVVS